ncbi:glycoside hydrolase family 27 protein [Paenibacillus psychroresistens]|uniref:Alpha-galactosidase n=1 Tax=Paenibacillus psychroresistens TaxID=1778678 RepID=A0A6B8RKC6_9BACL|nr:glycoside hydrolase family 27 protein [Paenibacillus psychroresistens]QGQ96052.1 glycoside hydrolase family 27 protein [Paenibacillus psychroresistens]
MKHHKFASKPPLGWNSWDCYGASVTEAEVRGNADYMAAYLKSSGWEYIIVDIQWYEPGANSSTYRPFVSLEVDAYSRLIPAVNRFPSSADGNGFKDLGAYVHSLGLKFGIHIMRGIPRQAVHANTPILGTNFTARDIAHTNSICPWNTDMYGVDPTKEGAQAYYDSLFQLYAEWGVDFIKVDDIAASRLYHIHLDEITLIRKAIDNCGRDIVLSLSPGPAPLEYAEHLKANANMWRMTDDYWDLWQLLHGMFERCEKWYPHVGEGHWPDCDMLPLGHLGIRSVDGGGSDRWTRFTKDEQVTMMTLWSIFRSPLFFGGELRDNDVWTLALLTNKEILEVQQNSHSNKLVYSEGNRIVWTAKNNNNETYAALFNIGEEMDTVRITMEQLGLSGILKVKDLWSGEEVGTIQNEWGPEIPPHGSRLVKLY